MNDRDDPLILVVDDDPVTRIRVRSTLEDFGYTNVKEAADGLEAKSFLESRRDVDLVITDILMPGLDGIELLRWGRENVPGPEWVLLSGVDTFDAAVEAIRSGAFDFLAKPPGTEELEVAVRNAVEQRRLLLERDRLYRELEETNGRLLDKVRELEDKSELLRRDLERAEIIQRALLPTAPPPIESYCIQALYRPGRYVGGDLYDVVRLDDRHVGIYVADATGHGVTAAMLSVLFKQQLVLIDESGRPLPPAVVLEKANRSILDAVEAPGLFLTAAYGVLDTAEGEIVLASAGHPPVLHVHPDGEAQLIKRTGPALGLTEDVHFGEERIRLRVDDRLLLYTDGLLAADTALDVERTCRLLSDAGAGAEDVLTLAVNGESSSGSAPDDERDDITLLLLDVHAGVSRFDNGALNGAAGTRPLAPQQSGVVFYGESDEASFLAMRGRATWIHADAFFEAALGILDAGRSLVVDLSECEYMDSTCLGTMHELVLRGSVRLQGVQPDVGDLFEELSMTQVLSSIEDGAPLPEMHPLAMQTGDGAASPLRILRAHEALAELSSRNQEKFEEVVETLRSEIAGNSET